MERRRVPELDGLRGVAVLTVVISHLAGGVGPHNRPFLAILPWHGGAGGLVGVQLFFVLSGYLITNVLLQAREERRPLRRFYGRRVRRLVPALAALCVIYATYLLVARPSGAAGGWGAIAHAMTYTANLGWLIHWKDNNFLGHTWSLAVEEQFYLLWPIALGVATRWGRTGVLRLAAVGVAATIALQLALPLFLDAGQTHVLRYNVLRWDALLAGAALAVMPRPQFPRWAQVLAWATFALLFAWVPPRILPMWTYPTATAACFVLVASSEGVGLLANRVLRHVGTISYGLYLWHVFILRFGWPGPISLVVSLAAAEASFRWVETPFLRRPRSDDEPLVKPSGSIATNPSAP